MSCDLVVLAAGIGSRFGGLKQIEPVGPGGELVIEYSAYDARRAGFNRMVCVIRRDIEKAFRTAVGRRLEAQMDVTYAFQELGSLPSPYTPPPARGKPWGTGQAVLTAESAVQGSFAVINADDFYGASAYRQLAGHFCEAATMETAKSTPVYAMVGYSLRQTLSDHGAVNRGVCVTDSAGRLKGINEVLKIERAPDGRARYPLTGGGWGQFTGDEMVSMTCFGFTPMIFSQLRRLFGEFLRKNSRSETEEFFLPEAIGDLLQSGGAEMRLLKSDSEWFGVTFRQDLPAVRAALRRLIAQGAYPERL